MVLVAASMRAADDATLPVFTDPGRRARLESAFPDVKKVFERYREERGIPGLVFGIVIDGDLACVKGLGVRNPESKAPVTAETVFRIASMTKSFTALAILKLRDEGRLSLDDLASKWIPELSGLRYPTRDTAPITIRELMTHSAGFPEDNPWGDRQLAVSDETLTAWLRAGIPFSTPSGTEYEYSNYGFALLGRIVSRATGMPYREYLEKEILIPLGMTSSTLEPSAVPVPLRATGYRKSGESYTEEPALANGAFGPMGGLLTSARDLGRYVAWQLSAWPPRDEEDHGPVRRSSRREMQQAWRRSDLSAGRPSPDKPLNSVAGAYGYGLRIREDCRFSHYVGHGGGLPGFGSWMGWLPDFGVGIFVMANLTYAGPSAAVDEAFDALRSTGALKPRQLPPSPDLLATRRAILQIWQKWDDGEANALAADNLFLDTPASQIHEEISRLKSDLGTCRPAGGMEPVNLLRGIFRMSCDRGTVSVYFTLAPTIPPKVQFLRFTEAIKPDPKVTGTVESLASLIGSSRKKELARISASDAVAGALGPQIAALRAEYGACRVGETLAGDGRTDIRIRFECDRGPLDASLRLAQNGKLQSALFTRPPDTPCVP
jgi:CubicO group peptidase (beta-lactamase class C family)